MTTVTRPPVPPVTIVMYHFIRPASKRFPGFAAIEPAAFREQLRYILRHHTPIRLTDVADAVNGSTMLPPRPVVLTFDDGYREHYDRVFPLLAEHGIFGAFFAARSALVNRRVLGANKVQFVLAAAGNTDSIIESIDLALGRSRVAGTGSAAEYRARWWVPSRFDNAAVTYAKRMLQHGLPEDVREPTLDALFQRYVTSDEAAFAEELYFTAAEAREMRSAGMEFGGHGDRHVPLPSLDGHAQALEIDASIDSLETIGAPRTPFLYCYVKGEHDATSLALLRARGCTTAVTTREDLAHPTSDNLLTLPRLDTTVLPVDGNASPSEWTRKAIA